MDNNYICLRKHNYIVSMGSTVCDLASKIGPSWHFYNDYFYNLFYEILILKCRENFYNLQNKNTPYRSSMNRCIAIVCAIQFCWYTRHKTNSSFFSRNLHKSL